MNKWPVFLDDAYVATDDERIEAAVKAFGGKVVMTSVHHKSGTDRCYEACTKVGEGFDVVVNIQGDEPFIQPSQLETVKACFDDPSTQIATLVKPFAADNGFRGTGERKLSQSSAQQEHECSLFQPFYHSVPT